MIYLDTDRLQEMVLTLEAANQRIDEATNLLMQITTHDSWGCKERYQINDYILENRKMIQVIQNTGGGFYKIMKQVASEFVETENNIGNMFSRLESVLCKILSVGVLGVTGNVMVNLVAPGHEKIRNIFDELSLSQKFPNIIISEKWEQVKDQEGALSKIAQSILQRQHTGTPLPNSFPNLTEVISVVDLTSFSE